MSTKILQMTHSFGLAIGWCSLTAASGFIVEGLAKLLADARVDDDYVYKSISGDLVSGFSICLLSALIIDDIFLGVKMSRPMKYSAASILAIAALLAAISRANQLSTCQIDIDRYLHRSLIIASFATIIAIGTKFFTFYQKLQIK